MDYYADILENNEFIIGDEVPKTHEEIDIKSKCSHPNTIFSDNREVCTSCGIVVDSDISSNREWKMKNSTKYIADTTRCHNSEQNLRTIFGDVKHLNFPNSIVNEANKDYKEIIEGSIYRGKNRRAIIVVCIFYAYYKNGESKPMTELCKMFDIKNRNVKEGLKKYVEHFPESVSYYVTPKHLIKEIMAKTKIEYSHYEKINELCLKLENKSELLNRSKPQSVAASIVYLYLCTIPRYRESLKLTKIKFSSLVGLSENTISKLGKEAQLVLGLNTDI